MRSWATWGISLAVLVIAAFAFREHLGFVREGVRQLSDAAPLPVALALIVATAAIVAMAEVMRLLMLAGDTRVGLGAATGVTLASNAWSTTLPGGPAFSAVLTFHMQRRWGASVMLCGWFLVVSSALSTMWLIIIAVAGVVFLGAEVNPWTLTNTFVLTVAASVAIYWVSRHPEGLERVVGKRWPGVAKHIGQLSTVQMRPAQFALCAWWSLANRLLDAATLACAVWAATGMLPAFHTGEAAGQATWAGVIMGYLAAKVAGSAPVTPGGVGTVDAALVGALVATGMPAVDATAAAVIYRVISFAFITAVGWVVYVAAYSGLTPSSLRDESRDERSPGATIDA